MLKRTAAWLPAVAWAGFLLWLGGRPSASGTAWTGLDKVAHFALYGVLGALAGRAWARTGGPPALLIVILGWSVGALDELHQTRVPTRTADPYDFVADAAGVLLGFAAGRRGPGRGGRPDSE